MLKNKKGLVSGLIAIIIILFLFAFFGLLSAYMWDNTNDAIQNLDNETVSQVAKDQVNELSSFFLWIDKIFMFFYIALLIGYIISSLVSPTDRPFMIWIFLGILIIVTIFGMFISNSWAWLIENIFPGYIQYFSYTNFFFDNLPLITLFTGLFGGTLFYIRRGISQNVNGLE